MSTSPSSLEASPKKPGFFQRIFKKKDAKPEVEKAPMVSYFSLFRFATGTDKYLLVLGILGAVVNGLAMPALVVVFGNAVGDSANPLTPNDEKMAAIRTQVLWMVALGTGALVFSGLWHGLFSYTAASQCARMRTLYLKAVLSQDIGWFDQTSPAEIPTRLTEDVTKVQSAIGYKAGLFIMNIVTFIGGYAVGFWRGWQVTVVMMVAMPIVAGAGGFLGHMLASGSAETQTWYARAGAVAEEVLSSIRTVTAFGGEEREITRYVAQLDNARRGGTKSGLLNGLAIGITFMAMYSTYALTMWFGGILVKNQETNPYTGVPYTGADILTIFFAVIIGTFALGQAMPPMQSFSVGRASAAGIHKLIDDRSSQIESRIQDGGDEPVVAPEDFVVESITLEGVDFHYPSRPEVKVLDNVSLSFKRGSKVAFVGESGSGKSTIVSLLERFYDAEAGRVMINGKDIRDCGLNAKQLRSLFGYVGQEPILFATSIRNNLRYGLHTAPSDNEMEKACKKANIHDFIVSLPEGYDTYCGSSSGGGSQISGGQKQRIAIARALLRKPQVLLLDEATSALDNNSEKMVQDTLDRLQKSENLTTISIAHRLSTVRNSDCIFVMSRGRLMESGHHEELMMQAGLYSALVSTQEAAEKEESVLESEAGGPLRHVTRKSSAQSGGHVVYPAEADNMANLVEASEEDAEKARVKEVSKGYSVPWKRLFGLSRPEMMYYFPAMFGAAAFGAALPMEALLLAKAMSGFYIFWDLDAMQHQVNMVSIAFVGLATVALIASVMQYGAFAFIGEHFTMRVRSKCFSKILEQDMGFFDLPENQPGRLTASLSTYAVKMNAISGTAMGVYCQAIASLVAGLIIGFIASPKLTGVMLAALPAMVLSGIMSMAVLSNNGEEGSNDLKQANQVASESVQNMRTIRALTAEVWTGDLFGTYVYRPIISMRKKTAWGGFWYGVSQGCMFYTSALGFYYGGILITEEGLEFEKMFQAMMAVFLAAMGAGQALAGIPDVNEAKVAAHDVFVLLDTESKVNPMSSEGKTNFGSPQGVAVSFKNVHFAYPTRPDVPILRGLTFDVAPGQSVALVGPSGGGKSTVLAMLQRHYDPSAGYVKVDDVALPEVNVAWWRQQMGPVAQEPVLFDLNLLENVRYGRVDATFEEVKDASVIAGMSDYAGTSVPWDSALGPRGGLLSGGQKQRAAIARAFLRKPRMVLLDEATSALDSQSEKQVQDAIDRYMALGKPTTFTVAHRLSTIQDADVIFVISEGRLVERGTHEELMSSRGVYYDLYQTGQK